MKQVDFKFTLPISIIKEDESFIAYTPALDLSTVGDTFEEAQERFVEAVQIFFEEINEQGTVDEALSDLGWKRHDNKLTPPVVVSTITQSFSIPNIL
jgi:predicted RNase H-like HicB family nuclease